MLPGQEAADIPVSVDDGDVSEVGDGSCSDGGGEKLVEFHPLRVPAHYCGRKEASVN